MAALHARSLHPDDARTLALLDSPDQFEFELAPGEKMGAEDRRLLWEACRAFTYHCYACDQSRPVSDWDRDSASVDLCRPCMDDAEMENAHADGYHDEDPEPHCPDCQLTTAG